MRPIRAIVVDDEYFNRELLKMMVLRLNPIFEIVGEAENIRNAHRLVTELRPEVVFIDIRMPDGSGVDLLRKFPERDFEAVFVTGNDDYVPPDYRNLAVDYVLKPIDTEKLRVTLNEVQSQVMKKRG